MKNGTIVGMREYDDVCPSKMVFDMPLEKAWKNNMLHIFRHDLDHSVNIAPFHHCNTASYTTQVQEKIWHVSTFWYLVFSLNHLWKRSNESYIMMAQEHSAFFMVVSISTHCSHSPISKISQYWMHPDMGWFFSFEHFIDPNSSPKSKKRNNKHYSSFDRRSTTRIAITKGFITE